MDEAADHELTTTQVPVSVIYAWDDDEVSGPGEGNGRRRMVSGQQGGLGCGAVESEGIVADDPAFATAAAWPRAVAV